MRFGQFAAGVLSGDEIVGFAAHAAGGFGAAALDERFNVFPREALERAGHHDSFSLNGACALAIAARLFQVDADRREIPGGLRSVGAVEPQAQRRGHFRADTIHRLKLIHARGGDGVHRGEVLGQQLGRVRADVADVECPQHARQRAALARLDSGQQIVDTLLTHAVELNQIRATLVQAVEVAEVRDEFLFDQRLDQDRARAFDIHLITAAKESEPLDELRRTKRIDAAQIDAAFVLHDGIGADRARCRRNDFLGGLLALAGVDRDHLRNNLAGLLDRDRVADVQTEPANLIEIVQRRAAHGRAAKLHRLEIGPRRNRP